MVAVIAGLPEHLRVVPDTLTEWEVWRDKALAFRTILRAHAEADESVRDAVLAQCAADAAYEMLVFGVVFEPRDRPERPSGWYPMIPYHFQVNMLRWIDEVAGVMTGTESARLGRGDGVIEKARGMAWSWTICAWGAHQWRHKDGRIIGYMSYKEDVVDKTDDPASLFFKLEACLGVNDRVPAYWRTTINGQDVAVPMRAPSWLLPPGYDNNKHNRDLLITHPTKTNMLVGFTTTERSGTGARASVLFLDEAAKFKEFAITWNSASAVTDHRIAGSSADLRFGTGFRDIARHAARAQKSGGKGPAFLRMPVEEHPERDAIWKEELEARHSGSDYAEQAYAREYELDYEAGHGAYIYPRAGDIEPAPLIFNPANHRLDFCIDPGVRDNCAFHLVTYDPGTHRYGVYLSYANSGKPADFYASLLTNQPLADYDYSEDDERVMEVFGTFKRHVRFWIGDPAGKARSQATATSFYDELLRATLALTDQRGGVKVWSSDKVAYKQVTPRIASLRWLLPLLDFNDTPDVLRTLEAVKDHRYAAINEGSERSSANALPVRTWGHDRVTALEFYACHRRLGGDDPSLRPTVAKSYRVTMSGKPITPGPKQAGYGLEVVR
jgi:hypothetical protein